MKKMLYLASVIFVVNSLALDINRAIELSMVNNNLIKEYKSKISESEEVLNGSDSLFMPKLNLSYNYDNKFKTNEGQNKNDSELNLNLSYNIFNGFKDENSIKNNKNKVQISRYQYEDAKFDIIFQTKQDYISYLKAKKNTLVQKKAVKLFQKQYGDAKNFYDNGVNITLNNLLEVEISLLESQKLLKEAISDEKVAKQRLFTTIGTKINEEIEEVPLKRKEYFVNTYKTNITQTITLQELKKIKASLKNEKQIIKGSYYPKLDATLQHKRYGDSFALNGVNGMAEPQDIALLQLSWNLFNGNKDKSDMISYNHKISQINYQIEQYKDELELKYIEANETLILEKQNLKISKKTFEQAKVNYDIVLNSFKQGIVSSKDLIDANYLLTKSESSYYDTYYNNLLAVAQLERLLETTHKE